MGTLLNPLIPPDLLVQMRLNHLAIVDTMDLIRQNARSYKTAKPLIRVLYKQLTEYFDHQNNVPYDRLVVFFKDDRSSLKMLEFLDYELKNFKVMFLEFFSKYLQDLGDRRSGILTTDFSEFSILIQSRIEQDEKYLSPFVNKFLKAGISVD